jgi:hypothetical protein
MAGPRYQPGTACGAQVPRTAGFSWIRTRIPGGASGVRLKSKSPCTCAYAERCAWRRLDRSRLRVCRACGRSRSHKFMGKSGGTELRPAMKWFLNVRMARSAAFRRCTCGGDNWTSMCWASMNWRSALDASLSNR